MDNPKLIVNSFASAFADAIESQNSLAINISDFDELNLYTAQAKVKGFGWLDSIPPETQYDFIVANLPIGMRREKFQIGNEEISVI